MSSSTSSSYSSTTSSDSGSSTSTKVFDDGTAALGAYLADRYILEPGNLGEGGQARVYKVSCIISNTPYALKVSKISPSATKAERKAAKQAALDESAILANIKHRNVVSLFDWYIDPHTGIGFQLLEYCGGGDLLGLLKAHDDRGEPLSEQQVKLFLVQLVEALRYLHNAEGDPRRQVIVHRDLKLENILVKRGGVLAISDFGLSKQLGQSGRTFSRCGTPGHLAPELLNGTGYGPSVDLWGLGLIVYQITTFKFPSINFVALLSPTGAGYFQPKISDEVGNRYNRFFQILVNGLLAKAPERRPSCVDLLKMYEFVVAAQEAENLFTRLSLEDERGAIAIHYVKQFNREEELDLKAQEVADQVADLARERADQVADLAREKANQVADLARERANQVADLARERAELETLRRTLEAAGKLPVGLKRQLSNPAPAAGEGAEHKRHRVEEEQAVEGTLKF